MKKILAAILAIVLAVALCACFSNQHTDTSSTPDDEVITSVTESTNPTTNTEDTDYEVDLSAFRELEVSSESIDAYRAEVESRLKYDSFLTDDEEEAISELLNCSHMVIKSNGAHIITFSNLYGSTSDYYFPVLYRDGSALFLWYTTETGSVLIERLYGHMYVGNYIGSIHISNYEETMFTNYNYKMTYNSQSSKVTIWQFGHEDVTYQLPAGSIYCGFSAFEGHIFRCGTDVYALDAGTWEFSGTITRIATGVAFVIAADYKFSSDPWSQPLFLMEDGSIKCYISWAGDADAPEDDPSHLCDLQYEGGYH